MFGLSLIKCTLILIYGNNMCIACVRLRTCATFGDCVSGGRQTDTCSRLACCVCVCVSGHVCVCAPTLAIRPGVTPSPMLEARQTCACNNMTVQAIFTHYTIYPLTRRGENANDQVGSLACVRAPILQHKCQSGNKLKMF